jgi:pimeloyl-ACP methyl ester carboxylesterase
MAKPQARNIFTDLQGSSKAVIDAVHGITDIVERMHRNIAGLAPVRGQSLPGPTRGITGFVYRRVRGVTSLVGSGLDSAFSQLAKLPVKSLESSGREAMRAAVNGIFGDYLAETGNPLAIPMSLRSHGKEILLDRASLQQVLDARESAANGRVLVMVHGLCMNDLQWRRNQHDHGETLAAATNATVLYLHYNSGRHIFDNGREFAQLLDTLVANWPVRLERLDIVGHSMGGLVARSAIQFARTAQGRKQVWLARLRAVVFLGTPHQGSPLERAGSGVDSLLGFSPYTAPFASLGRARSAGIQDLRHGRIDESVSRAAPVVSTNGAKKSAPRAPTGVKWYAIAASKQKPPRLGGRGEFPSAKLAGDGLVPVASALGVSVAAGHRATFYEVNHFDLLSSQAVCDKIEAWLQAVR